MYIPKGKLDPQIYYTNGGEYYYSTTSAIYVGYYHKDVYGNAYTGKEHTVDSISLIQYITSLSNTPTEINGSSTDSNIYSKLNPNSATVFTQLPINDSEPPQQSEYEQTYYTRYILQYMLSSQPFFIEVNKNTYFTYKNNVLDGKYFKFSEVLWKISGPLYDVVENGILMVGGVIDSNKRSIQNTQKTMPGIENYLTDLLLYYRP